MEIKKKLIAPSGHVYDIKYLYTVIISLKRKNGNLETNDKTMGYFKKMLNDYNYSKASKYGLSSKPRDVNTYIVKHVLTELKNLKLIRIETGRLYLTSEGENIASLIENKDSKKLKELFTRLMLDNFLIFEYFLKRIKEVSNGKGIPIPLLSFPAFDKCNGDTKKIVENYMNIVNKHCLDHTIEVEKLDNLLGGLNTEVLENKTDKVNKLKAVIEKFVILELFGPTIKSRRAYDFVRSRTTFLELTNYANVDFDGFRAEVAYLISDFKPIFNKSIKRIDFSGGTVYVNYPTFEEIRQLIKDLIAKIYNDNKDEFGYIKIADVRDMVCRELMISDDMFDEYIKRLYKEEPHWLSFTYLGAGDKITEKSSPIIFEKPMREFYTLLKIT